MSASLEEFERNVIKDYTPLEMIQSCEADYQEKVKSGSLTDDDRFMYAWYLIKSRYKDDVRKGLKLMSELCKSGSDQRDQYYFLSLGNFKLEEYQQAELCINRVLNMEPNNHQAKQLKEIITDKIRKDAMITAGVVGGAALAGAVAIGGVVLLAAGVTKLIKR